MAEGRRYSEDEARAILERALRPTARDGEDPSSDGVSHEDLVAAASEIGVAPAALERAAREVAETRQRETVKARIVQARRAGFSAHLYAYVGVMVVLLALNWLTTPHIGWSLFPLLGWGLGLYFHARHALSKEVSDRKVLRELSRAEREAQKHERKADVERARETKRERKARLEKGAAELGAAVEESVGVILSKVAQEIRKKTDPVEPTASGAGPSVEPKGRLVNDFEAYVREARGAPRRARVSEARGDDSKRPDTKSRDARAWEEAEAEEEVGVDQSRSRSRSK